MHILNIPTNELDYAAIRSFLALGHKETLLHDYKADFPKEPYDLAKTVAAFANTHGGVLLVGVPQLAIGGPGRPAGVRGTPDELRGKVERAVLAHVVPFAPHDVHAVEIPAGEAGAGNHVVVVRVPESLRAPHVMSDGAIYSRVEDLTEPEAHTDIRRIEYQLERRRQVSFDRGRKFEESLTWFERRPNGIGATERLLWAFGLSPTFPFQQLCSERDVEDRIRLWSNGLLVPCPGGVLSEYDQKFDLTGKDGNYGAPSGIHVTSIGHVFRCRSLPVNFLAFRDLMDLVAESWQFSGRMLQALGWSGQTTVRAELRRVGGKRVFKDERAVPPFDVVQVEEQVLAADVLDADVTAEKFCLSLFWGLGYRDATEVCTREFKAAMEKWRATCKARLAT